MGERQGDILNDIREPYDCFKLPELSEYQETDSGTSDYYREESSLFGNNSVTTAEDNVPLTSDVHKPLDIFKIADNGAAYLQCLKSGALTGILTEKKEGRATEADTEKRMAEKRVNIGEIVDDLIQQELFICMNGEQLFMQKEDSYLWISASAKSEIMYLKALLKQYGLRLNASDCKAILNELKTEEDIWVEHLESIGEGQYDIWFLSGRRVSGVSGKFTDYLVSGQLKNILQPFSDGIRLFVSECCTIDAALKVESTILFSAYQNFILEYPEYIPAKQNQFVPFMKKTYGLQGGSTGKVRVIRGICLKTDEPD